MPYKDRDRQRAFQREWYARRRAEYLVDKRCVTCGSTDRLEVDHIDPTTKMSHRVWSWSAERRAAELAKCQILCKKHHKAKSRNEKSWRTRSTEAA
jgi:5-methylcytosine-specific restriction endonuclease McrA